MRRLNCWNILSGLENKDTAALFKCYPYFQILGIVFAALSQSAGFHNCSDEEVTRHRRSSLSFPSVEIRDGHSRLATGLHSIHHQNIRNLEPFSENTSLPWECGSNVTWRDLGELYFPRYISEVVCLESSCWYGHYTCRPVIQTIKVLKLNEDNCRDTTLPPALRRRWMLADVETSAFCQCSR